MANYAGIKATIDANVKQNNNQAITGQILNSVLNDMVDALAAGYLFKGVATTSTDPGTPDQKVFYVAPPGTYTHFGGLVVPDASTGFLKWDSAWHLEAISTGVADGSVTTAKIADGAITMAKLSSSLLDMLSNGYKYQGIAYLATDPGTPGQNVFYIASMEGTYTYFGGISVEEGEVAILKWDTAWHKDITGLATSEQVERLSQRVDVYQGFENVEENGFFVIDEQNNIGFAVTEKGTDCFFGDIARRSVKRREFYESPTFTPTSISLEGTISSVSTHSRQGGASVKNIYFQFHDTNDYIGVYDLRDLSLLATIETGDSNASYHCNVVSLGDYMNEGDRFPLFYVSMEALHQINVYHISNSYVCTKIQTITLQWPNAVNGWIDLQAGYIYCAESENLIAKGQIPPLSQNAVSVDMVEQFAISGALFSFGFQDLIENFGYQLIVHGFANSNSIQLVDMFTKAVIWTNALNLPEEPEAMGLYKDALYIVTIGGKVYKIF